MEAVSKDDLVLILKEMTERVEIGDSYEGYLNYLMPDPIEDESAPGGYRFEKGHDFDVEARFRVGNLDGQGGMKMIGETILPRDIPPELQNFDTEQLLLRLADRDNNISTLEIELRRCQSERSDSAAYAVRLQDEIGDLTTERRRLQQGLRHLYKHLENKDGIGLVIDTPGDSCGEIHPMIKPYLSSP